LRKINLLGVITTMIGQYANLRRQVRTWLGVISNLPVPKDIRNYLRLTTRRTYEYAFLTLDQAILWACGSGNLEVIQELGAIIRLSVVLPEIYLGSPHKQLYIRKCLQDALHERLKPGIVLAIQNNQWEIFRWLAAEGLLESDPFTFSGIDYFDLSIVRKRFRLAEYLLDQISLNWVSDRDLSILIPLADRPLALRLIRFWEERYGLPRATATEFLSRFIDSASGVALVDQVIAEVSDPEVIDYLNKLRGLLGPSSSVLL